jgi:glycosyltransferase involved in cell wall biosynthesis
MSSSPSGPASPTPDVLAANTGGRESSGPLVTVVIPVYNRTEYVRKALESAVGQTYANLDIVVTDSGSEPEALATLETIIEECGDERVRMIRHEAADMLTNNVGAMRRAPGTYVANLHDDDAWEPTFVERLVAGLEAHPDASMAFSDHYLMDDHGELLLERTEANTQEWNRGDLETGLYQPFYPLALVDRCVPAVMGSIYRTAAIDWDDFPDDVGVAYDLWLAYLACRDGQAAYYVDDRLTRYRTHGESVTERQASTVHQGLLYCYDRFLQDDRLASIQPGLLRWHNHYQVNVALHLLGGGRRHEARAQLRAVVATEWSARAIVGLLVSYVPGTNVLSVFRKLKALYESTAHRHANSLGRHPR